MKRAKRLLKFTPNLKFLENGLFRFSQPMALNDPYEALPGLMVDAYSEDDIDVARERAARNGRHGMSDEKLIALYLSPACAHRMDEKMLPGLWPMHQPALRQKPFDSLKEYDRAIAERAVELAKALANRKIGIFSLTENNHETMWAHYADDHRGVCITFDIQHEYFVENTPRQVIYTNDPAHVTINHGWVRFGGQTVDKNAILGGELNFIPQDLLLRKQLPWQYEMEWRITKLLCESTEMLDIPDYTGLRVHLFAIPSQAINGITFGWRADNASIHQALRVIADDLRWKHLWVRRRTRSLTGVVEEQVTS